MKNSELDEVDIKCPMCRRVFKGKHIGNPWETQGICDWCALTTERGGANEVLSRGKILTAEGAAIGP